MKSNIDALAAKKLVSDIARIVEERPATYKFMEVCGTHTMAIHAGGIKSLLPDAISLVSGPGCPVCVTETSFIDEAVLIGKEHECCLATFGDLIRVPGTIGSLGDFRAEGGHVKVVYSPLDALTLARELNPKPIVFLGVGFETTIPTIAATVKTARAQNIDNLYVLTAFKTIHPPLKILADKQDLSGFLLPGHVSAILGSSCYNYLPQDFGKPGVVAGFEPLDILVAVKDLVEMVALGRPAIKNDYKRVVREDGNPTARDIIAEVFDPADARWRGLGLIADSGLKFRGAYAPFDARIAFPVNVPESKDDPRCRCAAIITGSKTPDKCALFGKECTPEDPVGPCMVSSEGTCAAYYKYGMA